MADNVDVPQELIPADGFVVVFPAVSPVAASSEAGMLASEINNTVRQLGFGTLATQQRTNKDAMDLGIIVGVVLGAKATIEIAKGIAAGIQKYFARTNQSQVEIIHPDGRRITLTNIESADIANIVRALK